MSLNRCSFLGTATPAVATAFATPAAPAGNGRATATGVDGCHAILGKPFALLHRGHVSKGTPVHGGAHTIRPWRMHAEPFMAPWRPGTVPSVPNATGSAPVRGTDTPQQT